MRLVSAAVAASLLLSASGCALAVAPAVGLGAGTLIGVARNQADSDASISGPIIVGGLAGVVVDVLSIIYLAHLGANFDLSERRAR